jgi:shikimate dehydrogenase
VNATPLGMKDNDALPISPNLMDLIIPDAAIFDAVYNIKGTPLQRASEDRGLLYIGGLDMLLYQGVRAFELWTDVTPDINLMRNVLQDQLVS